MPSPQPNNNSYAEQEFPAVKESIIKMLGLIEEFADKNGLPPVFKYKLSIVGDELISNIVNHGYAGQEGKITLRLSYDHAGSEFTMVLIDGAKEFNQLEVVNPNVGTEEVIKHIGGLGIHIVKQIMTECSYDRINGQNILTLKKRFEGE